MHLSFKSVWIKEHKVVICIMTSSSNSSQSTHPTGRVLWEKLLVLSRISLVITSGQVEFLSPGIFFLYLFACRVIFHALLLSVDFFVKITLFKKFFEKQYQCQSVWIQIRPKGLLGLIWVQKTKFVADRQRLRHFVTKITRKHWLIHMFTSKFYKCLS